MQHPLVENAKSSLGITDVRDTIIVYSGQFTPFNANVRADRYEVTVKLSKEWRGRDPDVVQGLVEHLLAKLFKKRVKTPRMALYQDFLLYVHREQREKSVEDARLMASFQRVNKKYLEGKMELPNIKWGSESFRKLGHYHYASDTVVLSTILLENQDMLDFVMFHELLHKKHGLTRGGRAHTKAFKLDESRYEEATDAELNAFVRRMKRSWF